MVCNLCIANLKVFLRFLFSDIKTVREYLRERKSEGRSHCLVHLHVNHCFGFFLGSGSCRRGGALCGIVVGADSAGVEIVHLDGFDTNNVLAIGMNREKPRGAIYIVCELDRMEE